MRRAASSRSPSLVGAVAAGVLLVAACGCSDGGGSGGDPDGASGSVFSYSASPCVAANPPVHQRSLARLLTRQQSADLANSEVQEPFLQTGDHG